MKNVLPFLFLIVFLSSCIKYHPITKATTPDVHRAYQSIVHAYYDEYIQCYRHAHNENPETAGKLKLEFKIKKSGDIRRLNFIEDSLSSAGMTRCIEESSLEIRFPSSAKNHLLIHGLSFGERDE